MKNDGGAAFPHEQIIREDFSGRRTENVFYHKGMSLRAYFLGQLLTNITVYDVNELAIKKLVKLRLEIADVAIKALEKEE